MSTYEDPQKAIDAGGQALRPSNRFPWYDPAKDGLQRVEVRPPEKPNYFHCQPGDEFPDLLGRADHAGSGPGRLGPHDLAGRAAAQAVEPRTAASRWLIGEAQRIEALPYPVARAKPLPARSGPQFLPGGELRRAP